MSEFIIREIDCVLATKLEIVGELVRCKDCKWFKTTYMWDGRECKVCGIEPYGSIREHDDFCSRGERKDDVPDTDVGKKEEEE